MCQELATELTLTKDPRLFHARFVGHRDLFLGPALEPTFSFITFKTVNRGVRITARKIAIKAVLVECASAGIFKEREGERESMCPKRGLHKNAAGVKCASPAVFRLSLV